MKKKGFFIGVNKWSYSLAIQVWVLILYSERESIIISPCGGCLLCLLALQDNCL